MTVRGLRRAERARLALPERGGVLIEQVGESSPLQGKVAAGEVILRVADGTAEALDTGVQEVAALVARMEECLDGGGYVDVLRAQGLVERVTLAGE